MTAEWYYIGHYGQLGPLTREQIDELIEGGVIARDTYIWRAGMNDWIAADQITDLTDSFRKSSQYNSPPPPPSPGPAPSPIGIRSEAVPNLNPSAIRNSGTEPLANPSYVPFPAIRSDKSRTLGGILQLVLPGVGRIYLGYTAIGALQLILALCGVGWMWSIVDGVIILAGGVKMDGYGRQLNQ